MRLPLGRTLARALLALALLPIPAVHADSGTAYALEDLGLRGEPDSSASVIQKVPRGTALEMVGGRHHGWIRVAAPGSGYALYVEISKLGAAPPPPLEAAAPAATVAPPVAAPVPAATPRPVVATKPLPRPKVAAAAPVARAEKGKGHGKVLAIGGGVLAAGGGAAVAAASGSSSSGAPPVTTPSTPSGPASAVVFVSSDVPKRFADASASASALMVGGLDGTITDARVTVNLSTSCGRDLALHLVHPDGTEVVLMFQGAPGCSPTRLVATFPTERAPYEPLAKLFGKTTAGAWHLRATDLSPGGGAGGELGAWSLALTVGR